MKDLMQNPMFFYAIAFVIFIALAYRFGRKPATDWLDAEIAQIRAELDAARHLRAEAEAALADGKEKQARAEADAQSILASARHQVETMRKQAEADLAAALARHEHLAAERIHLAELDAIADVRAAVLQAAMAIARKTLTDNLSESDATMLVEQAMAEIPALKAAKPKAA